jgi:hypothetical protein
MLTSVIIVENPKKGNSLLGLQAYSKLSAVPLLFDRR